MTRQNASNCAIVVAGAGFTGQRLLQAVVGQSNRLIGLSRSHSMEKHSIESIQIDLDSPATKRIDVTVNARICYLIPPSMEAEPETRFRRFVEEVLRETPERLLLISTSGVYGDCQGEWVN